MVLFMIVSLSIVQIVNYSTVSIQRARQRTLGARFAQRAFALYDNVPYLYLFAVDSSSSSYGLQGTFGHVSAQVNAYPYLAVLDDLKKLAIQHGFTRYTIEVKFYLRDSSDIDGDGETGDIRPFTDNNHDKIDDYDPNIKYLDQNSDGDYNDFYGAPEITEQPDTHLKKITLKVYRGKKFIYQQSRLISLEKLSGTEFSDSSSIYRLVITSPAQNTPAPDDTEDIVRSSAYRYVTAAQIASFNLHLTAGYPTWIRSIRADSSSAIRITGYTDPVATVSFMMNCSTNSVIATCTADIWGNFNLTSVPITDALVEGRNRICGIASKDGKYSPYAVRDFIYDINPPKLRSITPNTSVVHTLQPFVSAIIGDTPVTSGKEVSGVCQHPVYLTENHGFGDTQVAEDWDYFSSTQACVSWLNPSSYLPVKLTNGFTYVMKLEAGDYAQYKATATWTFACVVPSTDTTPVSIDQLSPPAGTTAADNPPDISCRIFDNESGVDYNSINMYLDGTKILDHTNLSEHYTVLMGTFVGAGIFLSPDSPLSTGIAHTVIVNARHFAGSPYDKISSTATWSFYVP
jgi:hypothetical protein